MWWEVRRFSQTRPSSVVMSNARANVKFRHRHSPTFQYGGGIQTQYQQMGRFILWDDFSTSAFLPMEGTSVKTVG